MANEGIQGYFRKTLQPFVSGSPFPSVDQGTWLFNGGMDYPPGTGQFGRDFILSSFLTSEHSGIYSYHVTSDGGVATSVDFNVTVISECLTFHLWWGFLRSTWYYINHNHSMLSLASLARDQSVQVHRVCAQRL